MFGLMGFLLILLAALIVARRRNMKLVERNGHLEQQVTDLTHDIHVVNETNKISDEITEKQLNTMTTNRNAKQEIMDEVVANSEPVSESTINILRRLNEVGKKL
jgi:hypothetical protein